MFMLKVVGVIGVALLLSIFIDQSTRCWRSGGMLVQGFVCVERIQPR